MGSKLRMNLNNLRAVDLVEIALSKPWNDVTAKAKPIQPCTQRFQVTVDVSIVLLDKVACFHSASQAVNKLEICTIETT